MAAVILFNKPYGVLSQFTDCDGHPGLRHHISEPGFYPAGRLDRDSEGLLILTDDGALQARISDPKHKVSKTYLVQVEGCPSGQQLQQLRNGIALKDCFTLPAQVEEIAPPELWQRVPPVRFRKIVPTSWLKLSIREGKNRQVRRMTAAVGLPTLRLVRWSIGHWQLDGLAPGEYRLEEFAPGTENSSPRKKAHRQSRKSHNAR